MATPKQPTRALAKPVGDNGTTSQRGADQRKLLGSRGEQLAADWYRRRSYRVVDRNWRSRNGELDLVLRRRDELVFCEVKNRSSRRFGHPVEAVTFVKQQRIRALALQWIAATGNHSGGLRFDVAAVEGGRVEVWKAAFWRRGQPRGRRRERASQHPRCQ